VRLVCLAYLLYGVVSDSLCGSLLLLESAWLLDYYHLRLGKSGPFFWTLATRGLVFDGDSLKLFTPPYLHCNYISPYELSQEEGPPPRKPPQS